MNHVPYTRIPPIPGLLAPFTSSAMAAEEARKQLFAAFAAPTDVESAQLIYAWAVRGDLASLFAGSARVQEPVPGADELARFIGIERALPRALSATQALPPYGVSLGAARILEAALLDDLPQRRLEAWCALTCLFALNRTDL